MTKLLAMAGAVAVAAAVASLSTAAGGSPGTVDRGAVPIQTTSLPRPGDRTEVITLDTAALIAQMADLPDPLPATPSPDRCVTLEPGSVTFPLFDGADVTIAGTSATLCEETSWWSLSWRGENRQPDGRLDSEGAAVVILNDDGSPQSGVLANYDVGDAWYRLSPGSDDGTTDEYELVGGNLPPPLEVAQTSPPPTTAPPVSSGSAATPATAVAGSPGYTG